MKPRERWKQRLIEMIGGQTVEEMEIEARRDAQENNYATKLSPYKPGTFAALCYLDECQKHFFGTQGALPPLRSEPDKLASGRDECQEEQGAKYQQRTPF